uniref:Uncharacterized protein n=1 Tax=mine drainage metagenome TaxID=410659 RepID=E6PTW7_9ZZZZ
MRPHWMINQLSSTQPKRIHHVDNNHDLTLVNPIRSAKTTAYLIRTVKQRLSASRTPGLKCQANGLNKMDQFQHQKSPRQAAHSSSI